MIRNSQHGFTRGNLIAFYSETTSWTNVGRAVDVTNLDLSRDFDTVCLNIITGKLRKCAAIQTALDWLDTWAGKKLRKLNIGKYRVLHFGRNNAVYHYRLGADLMENSFVEKDLWVLMDSKDHEPERCLCGQELSGILRHIRKNIASRSREVVLPHYSALIRPCLEYCNQSQIPQYKRDKALQKQVEQRVIKMIIELEHHSYEDRLRKLGLLAWNR